MSDIYPLIIVKDRYNGTYSGGKWTAWNLGYVPSKVDADDTECAACGGEIWAGEKKSKDQN